MKLKVSNLIYLLALYVPCETLISARLPVSGTVYSVILLFVEGFIYALLAWTVFRRLSRKRRILGSGIDFLVLLFILNGLLSIFVNEVDFVSSVVDMRSLLRYIALFYIIINIDFPLETSKKIIKGIIIIGACQLPILIYQHFFGISEFWYPRASELSIGGREKNFKMLMEGFREGREQGAAIGIFGDTTPMAIFFLIILCLITPWIINQYKAKRAHKLMGYAMVAIAFVSFFLSYARMAALLGLTVIPIGMILAGKYKQLLYSGSVLIVVVSIFLLLSNGLLTLRQTKYINPRFNYTNPVSNVAQIFNPSYQQQSIDNTRGWVLFTAFPALLKAFPPFGYGPDIEASLDYFVIHVMDYHVPMFEYGIINDVHWVGFTISYGFIGLLIWLLMLLALYKIANKVRKKSELTFNKSLASAFMLLVVMYILYTFVIRVFVLRVPAFYFWLFAGIIVREWQILKGKIPIPVLPASQKNSKT